MAKVARMSKQIRPARFTARYVFDKAILKDGDKIIGNCWSLEGAEALVDILNQVVALPFGEIGASRRVDDGCVTSNSENGRERVAHFVAMTLGLTINWPASVRERA